MHFQTLLLVYVGSMPTSIALTPRQLQATDSTTSVLQAMYETLGGVAWAKKTYWMEEYNPCGIDNSDGKFDWYGVTCQGDIGREFFGVKELEMPSNGLIGKFPSQIGQMSTLAYSLDLSNNHLSQTLPTQVGRLVRLKYKMEVAGNVLTGKLPTQIGQLQSTTFGLFLQGNSVSGTIPTQIGRLTNLEDYLYLQSNHLCGPAPTELGLLSTKNVMLSQNIVEGKPCPENISPANIHQTLTPTPNTRETIPSSRKTLSPTTMPIQYVYPSLFSIPSNPPSQKPSISPAKASASPTLNGENLLFSAVPTSAPNKNSLNPQKTPCHPGEYSLDAPGKIGLLCIPCPAGFFSNDSKSSSCEKCPQNTHSTVGSHICSRCDRGTSTEGATACRSFSDCITNKGWYRTGAKEDLARAKGIQLKTHGAAEKCPTREACIGADRCLKGSTDHLCLHCNPGFGKNMRGICQSCSNDHLLHYLRILLFLFTVMGLLFIFLMKLRGYESVSEVILNHSIVKKYLLQNSKRLISRGKIFVNVFQAQALTVSLYYGSFSSILSRIGPSIISSFDLVSRVDCFSTNIDFYNKFAIGILIPFTYAAFLVIVYAFVLRLPADASADVSDGRRAMIYNFLLSILFYFYLGTSSLTLQYFVCDKIEGSYYLRADPQIRCTDDDYIAFRMVAYFMLLLAISSPLLLHWLLQRFQKDNADIKAGMWNPPARQAAALSEATGWLVEPDDGYFEDGEVSSMTRIFHSSALGFHLYSSPSTDESGKQIDKFKTTKKGLTKMPKAAETEESILCIGNNKLDVKNDKKQHALNSFDNDTSSKLERHEISWEDFSAEVEVSRSEIRHQRLTEKSLAFLLQDFRPSWFLFEVYDTWRKLVLSMTFVVAPLPPRYQIVVAIFIASSELVLLGMGQPYKTLRDNLFASAGQLTIICFYAVILTTDASTDASWGEIMLMSPNVVFIIFFLFLELTESNSDKEYKQIAALDESINEEDRENGIFD